MTEWTREDLPSLSAALKVDDDFGNGHRSVTVELTLDAVVDHLNDHHPKTEQMSLSMLARVRRWKRERDEAVARAEKAERTASTVTRDEVVKAIDEWQRTEQSRGATLVDDLCDLFGIEATADPVEAKAEELMRVLSPETEDRTWGILTETAREDFRRLARHVLKSERQQAVFDVADIEGELEQQERN